MPQTIPRDNTKSEGQVLTLIFLHPQVIQKPSHDMKQQLAVYSKRVASSVTELIQAAEAMKGILTYNLFNSTVREEQEYIPQSPSVSSFTLPASACILQISLVKKCLL